MSSSTFETQTSRIAGLTSDSLLAVLARPIKRGIARIVSRGRQRRDIEELMALDDRMLADIGLSRSEVEYAVRHGRVFDRGSDRLLP